MSQSDIYTVLCLVIGEDVAFSVKIEKSETVSALKDLIKKENPNTFADIDAKFLDLYRVDIPDAGKEDLVASVEARRLDSPLLPSTELGETFTSTPKRHTVHFLVKPSRKRPASTQLTNEAKRKMKVDELPSLAPSSATEAKVVAIFGDKIEYNRPQAKRKTIPITLLDEIFGIFLQDCLDYVPTEAENRFLSQLRIAMLKDYDDEAKRASSFRDIFLEHCVELKPEKLGGSGFATDGDVRVENHLLVLSECKNELTRLTADPMLQGFLYYIESVKSGLHGRKCTRLPCIIIYYAGPYIGFAGTLWADKPTLEPLTPFFPFNTNIHDVNASRPLARSLGALKKALASLKKYYTRLSRAPPHDQTVFTDTEFPYRTHYTIADGKVDFQYDSRLSHDKLLFLVSVTNDQTKLCIKYTQKYSKKAHEYCAANEIAPTLYAVEELPGGWFMVVMEYLEAYIVLGTSPSTPRGSYEVDVKAAVNLLHQGGYVHGDIREVNTMVALNWDATKGAKNVKLVDFDWAGPEDTALYPANVNTWTIKRPMDATDGMPITKNHDLEMVNRMFRPVTD